MQIGSGWLTGAGAPSSGNAADHRSGAPIVRELYLSTRPDPSYVSVHLPPRGASSGTGVLLCPPLGWDELCTHRSRREWANALAAAGHAAMRVDLPGTGDSGGSIDAPDRLEAWTTAVAAAAAWLRSELGCSRVCAIGIGFGGMLAWLSIAQEAPIDDLVLWGVPVRGRRVIRELQAAASQSIDPEVDLSASPRARALHQAPGEDAGLLDESGQIITAQTMAALGGIDLLATPLPAPEARRVLVLGRSAIKTDAQVADHLRAAGAEVTVGDGDGFGELMQYVQESKLRADVVEASLRWLAAAPAATPGSRPAPGPSVAAAERMELLYDGAPLQELPMTLTIGGDRVRGILTTPVDLTGPDVCAVFFSGGSDRRIGPNRMWVETARRWAARGVAAVRIDPAGVGDSDGDERAWDDLLDHYKPVHVDHTLELLTALQVRGVARRFVLAGFCSGGYRAVQAALRDGRIAGVFAIGLPFFRCTWWAVNVRDSWLLAWEPKPTDGRLKIWIAQALRPSVLFAQRVQRRLVQALQFAPNRADHVLRRLSGQGVEAHLLLKSKSYAYEQLSLRQRARRVGRLARVAVECLPSDDHRFRPLLVQRFVNEALDASLARVIETETRRAEVSSDLARYRHTHRGGRPAEDQASSLVA